MFINVSSSGYIKPFIIMSLLVSNFPEIPSFGASQAPLARRLFVHHVELFVSFSLTDSKLDHVFYSLCHSLSLNWSA
jgi:hypothetical protein